MSDSELAGRVDALEAENKALKAKLQALTERLDKLSTGEAAAPVEKKTARKKATGKSTGVKKKKPTSAKKRAAAPAAEDSGDIDPARKIRYNIGKANINVTLPAELADAKRSSAAPSEDLSLEYVYGYNGKNSFSNLYGAKTAGSVVFSVAATGVVMDIATKEQKFFFGHNEDILSLAVHPSRPVVATGQLDPKGKGTPHISIWKEDDQTLIKKITYHDRGIIALSFTPDGKYLVSIGNDDSRTMAIWDWEGKSSTPLLTSPTHKDKVHDFQFNKNFEAKDSYQAVAVGAKCLKVFTFSAMSKASRKVEVKAPSVRKEVGTIPKQFHGFASMADGSYCVGTAEGFIIHLEGTTVKHCFKGHGGAAVGALGTHGDNLVSAASDGTLKVWEDFKETASHQFSEAKGKTGTRSMDVVGDTVVLGTKDNTVRTIDLGSGAVTTVLTGHSNDVWGVASHPTEPLMASTSSDRTVRVWNTTTKETVHSHSFAKNAQVKSASFSPDGSKLAVGLASGHIALFDMAAWGEPVVHKKIAAETIDSLDWKPDSSRFCAGSWDQVIYQVTTEGKVATKSKGHTSSVLMVNYSSDGAYMMSNSRDYEILFWDANTGKRVNTNVVADAQWPKWNGFIGWPVVGIWKGADDGTDINSVDYHGNLLVVGDDFGIVRLYKYPCLAEKANFKSHEGHSSHVMNVRFSGDGSKVFSAGGGDMAVFQWAV